MNDISESARFERWLSQTAGALPVPAVASRPAAAIRPRRLAPGLAVAIAAVLLILGLLLVPPVRATLRAWFTIGSVQILLDPAVPAPNTTPVPLIATPNLPGQVSLETAQARVDYPLPLLDELGPPTAVYVYSELGQMVTLYWGDRPLLLHIIDQNLIFSKISPSAYAEQVTVAGQTGYWISGTRQLDLYDQQLSQIRGFSRVVDSPVLIWTDGELTFRLEGAPSLEAAVGLAEMISSPES